MKTRVRALIIQGGNILLIHRVKKDQEYWVFPGGGVEDSDSSPQEALKRECLEELGVVVDVGASFAERPFDSKEGKQVELYYSCRIVGGELGAAKGPEATRDPEVCGTYQNEWVPLSVLSSRNVLPAEIRDRVVLMP